MLAKYTACSSESGGTPAPDNNEASQNQSEETTDSDASKQDEAGSSGAETLNLGETATIEDTLGTYEITPNSVKFEETADGELPGNEIFVVVDITIKNISDEELEAKNIAKADLFDSEEIRMPSLNYYNFVDNFSGPIAPGEDMNAQLVFDHSKSTKYELVFGYALSSVSNELI